MESYDITLYLWFPSSMLLGLPCFLNHFSFTNNCVTSFEKIFKSFHSIYCNIRSWLLASSVIFSTAIHKLPAKMELAPLIGFSSPSLLVVYNQSTFDLQCNPPYIVKIFLIFWSISLRFSFFHSVLLATFLKVGTTYVLMVLNTFFVYAVNFKSRFNIWKLDSHYSKKFAFFAWLKAL